MKQNDLSERMKKKTCRIDFQKFSFFLLYINQKHRLDLGAMVLMVSLHYSDNSVQLNPNERSKQCYDVIPMSIYLRFFNWFRLSNMAIVIRWMTSTVQHDNRISVRDIENRNLNQSIVHSRTDDMQGQNDRLKREEKKIHVFLQG